MITQTASQLSGALNWADYTLLGVIALSAIVGVMRGFIREMLSVITWGVAFAVAFSFRSPLAEVLKPHIKQADLCNGVSFLALFVGVLIIGAVVNFFIASLVSKTGMGAGDRCVGLIFGVLRGLLVVSLVIMLLGAGGFDRHAWWQHSLLIGYFKPLVVWLDQFLPNSMAAYFAPGAVSHLGMPG